MRVLLLFFFICFLPLQSIQPSMARLDDSHLNDSPLFKKKDYQSFKFFRNTSCSFEDYSFPSSSNQPQTFRACIIDLSPLKDKKQELLNHIKNPSNWSERYIHPSLFNKYHRYGNRRFKLDGNSLVIYVPQDALLVSILDAAKNTDCLPLSASEVQEDKIPKGSLFNKGCSIRVQNQQLKADGNLHQFYNPQAIDSLFQQKEDGITFKNLFLDSLKKSPFNFNNPIIYSTRFTLNTEKSDSNKNLNAPTKGRNQLKAAQKTSRLKNRSADSQDSSSDSAGFEIHIIEVSQDLDKIMKSLILRSALKSCSPLKLCQIDENRIPENRSFLQACSLRLQDHRLKPGSSLYNFYKQDQAIDNLFKSDFKNQFIISLKAPDIFKENIKNTIIYSKLSREKNNPIAQPDSSQKINPDPTQIAEEGSPDDCPSADPTQGPDDGSDADLGLFEIHIIQTDDLKSLILKENFKDCSKIDANHPQISLASHELFYRGCRINVKDLPISFDQNQLNNDFNDSQFKLRLIKKIKDHFNFKDQAYPNKLILKTSDLNDGSFDIFIVQTLNKIVQRNIREIKQASNELIQDFLYQAEKIECHPLIHDDLMSININLSSQYIAEQACQISLTNENLKRNGLVKKDKIQELIDNSTFKQKFINKVNLKRKRPFDIDKTEVYYYLKKSDNKLIIILYQLENKDLALRELIKKIIQDKSKSAISLNAPKKELLEKEVNLNDDLFISYALEISAQDDQVKSGGSLSNLFNSQDMNAPFTDGSDFKQKIIDIIKKDHPQVSDDLHVFIKITNQKMGTFEISFYQTLKKEEAVLNIFLKKTSSVSPLSEDDKRSIENQDDFDKESILSQGFKIRIQDNQLKPDAILSSVFNKKTLDSFFNQYIFMENIQSHLERNNKKLYGKGRVSLKNINQEQGEAEILIYSIENRGSKSLKELIINNLGNCHDLDKTELQALKAKENKEIYDRKYISNACQIDIEDNLLKTTEENEIENLFDIYFKQEIADQLNKPSLNLDKHMSVYPKFDKAKANLKITLAETRKAKKSELIKTLYFLKDNFNIKIIERAIEEAYGVKYINLGLSLYWDDDRFKNGQEFDKSFALIDEILKTDQDIREDFIDKTNEYRRSQSKLIETISNNKNIIIRGRFNGENFIIDIFTLSKSPKGAIQATILDWISSIDDNFIDEYYESIKSSDAIEDFEAGRKLKKGLKIIEIYDSRLEEGGSLSSYFDNAKEFNPLLDDADFKRKMITKINDYFEDKLFSTDNLENIKIKAQNVTGMSFDLVVYELEPK